jgi:hypothetical protein
MKMGAHAYDCRSSSQSADDRRTAAENENEDEDEEE